MLRSFLVTLTLSAAAHAAQVLVEAEHFREHGGWVLDTQFIETMGSPYLLAHGLGEPVRDATTVTFPSTGKWRVWVRTMDWVARWQAPGAPGKFQLIVDGKALAETFGTKGAAWEWHDGGEIEIGKAVVTIALRDLTGFDGRCDAILFTNDGSLPPDAKFSNDANARSPQAPLDGGSYDLVVVGGGYGGTAAALSAARMGCRVALVQNRAVLGGNGSSEVRVWAMGGIRRGLYPMLGEIVEEFQDYAKLSPGTYEEFGDDKKEKLVRSEKNIALFFNHHVTALEKSGARIASVTALDVRTGARRKFSGKLFCDATGHAYVAALAGADATLRETEHLGMSNMWRWKSTDAPVKFPETPWALPLTMDDFPYPQRNHAQWFWESGFDKHPIAGLEDMRDWNLRAAYGAWNAMKNGGGAAEHANAKLEWLAYIGGPRESRQVLGDVVLTEKDIVEKKAFPDATVPTTWDIDLHYPKEQFAKGVAEKDPFISKAVFGKGVDRKHGYPVPYRCFYSRNVDNLFTAGRCVSVTHEALGTVRVMKTGGMIGEVVGKAASVCIKHDAMPRDIYDRYFPELQELLKQPGAARRATVNDPITLPAGYTPPAPAKDTGETAHGPDVKTLGIALDDTQAKLTGTWGSGAGLPGYFGAGYRYRGGKVAGAARYEFTIVAAGEYEARINHAPHENRATNTPVTIESAGGKKTVTVNQRTAAPLEKGFISLGRFHFAPGKPAVITIGDGSADGNIHADAAWLVPVK
jgi:FAD dependent oxidoreductase/Pyridine nucleotide-disulphide oxidoreductase